VNDAHDWQEGDAASAETDKGGVGVGWALLLILVVPGSLFALIAGWLVDGLACDTEGSEACDRQDLANAQLWVALAGVALVTWIGITAWRRQYHLTRPLLLCALVLYLGWAVLNDAAVHGWGADMPLVP
jgi:hypothetical protein